MSSEKNLEPPKEIQAELVQLDNGDIVLREIDKDSEPLIRFSFSGNLEDALRGEKLDITWSMIEAGMKRHKQLILERDSLLEKYMLDGSSERYLH